MQKFLVLKYIFKINSIVKNKKNINLNSNIKKIVSKIKKSKKVIFIAQGNSGIISKQFYTLLILKNIYAIFVEGKPDQMKLIENYNKDDFLIVISHSFNHE
jgi:DNA-binding MurR/RpiR family transcriptional regulator